MCAGDGGGAAGGDGRPLSGHRGFMLSDDFVTTRWLASEGIDSRARLALGSAVRRRRWFDRWPR
jgi:hypothetical protein